MRTSAALALLSCFLIQGPGERSSTGWNSITLMLKEWAKVWAKPCIHISSLCLDVAYVTSPNSVKLRKSLVKPKISEVVIKMLHTSLLRVLGVIWKWAGTIISLWQEREWKIVNHNMNYHRHLGNCGEFGMARVQTITCVWIGREKTRMINATRLWNISCILLQPFILPVIRNTFLEIWPWLRNKEKSGQVEIGSIIAN